ncbi:MAG: hypothetical protein H7175_22695 [Burkholderiales bacterium]|nr:hypothetical protein [Anaerolineae bacterium]
MFGNGLAVIALAIIEFVMFAAGIWALLNDALPERGFDTIFGKGDYQTGPQMARLFGFLLILPFVAFLAKAIVIFGTFNWFFADFYIGVFFIDIVIAVLWARHIKKANAARTKVKGLAPKQDVSAFVDDDWH